ncbi:MAG TPA: ATP-binding cassette domain-containing protein [Oscillospiraceae bacterium]|nr:ATP-binding cassette domain-containing protein [Oscillospiraceae bacterium]
MLKINNLTKTFGKKKALDGVSITFDNGVYGLLGPNGSGKTTLLRCITMLYKEGDKAVTYNGKMVSDDKNYLNNIGYLPQQFGLFKELTVFETLMLIASFKEIDNNSAVLSINKCLELVNLTDMRDKRVKTLSGGMVRRLGIAQALLNDPQLIIFDEPTAGLDPEERLRFKSIITQIKKEATVIISTHIVEDVEAVCNHIVIMDSGKLKANLTGIELQEKASGKVYEILESKKECIKGKYYIEKRFEDSGEVFLRVLTADKQDFEPCSACVEDGYLCVIKGI